MKITKIEWDEIVEKVAVTVEGRADVECFPVDEIKDKQDLIEKLKNRLQQVDEAIPSVVDATPAKIAILKELEGTEF